MLQARILSSQGQLSPLEDADAMLQAGDQLLLSYELNALPFYYRLGDDLCIAWDPEQPTQLKYFFSADNVTLKTPTTTYRNTELFDALTHRIEFRTRQGVQQTIWFEPGSALPVGLGFAYYVPQLAEQMTTERQKDDLLILQDNQLYVAISDFYAEKIPSDHAMVEISHTEKDILQRISSEHDVVSPHLSPTFPSAAESWFYGQIISPEIQAGIKELNILAEELPAWLQIEKIAPTRYFISGIPPQGSEGSYAISLKMQEVDTAGDQHQTYCTYHLNVLSAVAPYIVERFHEPVVIGRKAMPTIPSRMIKKYEIELGNNAEFSSFLAPVIASVTGLFGSTGFAAEFVPFLMGLGSQYVETGGTSYDYKASVYLSYEHTEKPLYLLVNLPTPSASGTLEEKIAAQGSPDSFDRTLGGTAVAGLFASAGLLPDGLVGTTGTDEAPPTESPTPLPSTPIDNSIDVLIGSNPPMNFDLETFEDEPVNADLDPSVFNDLMGPIMLQLTAIPDLGDVLFTGGIVTYVPGPNLFGFDTFSFFLTDGVNQSTTFNYTVTIFPVNDAPVHILPAEQVMQQGGSLELSAANGNLISVFDPDGMDELVTTQLNISHAILIHDEVLADALGINVDVEVIPGSEVNTTDFFQLTFTGGTVAEMNMMLDGLVVAPDPGFGNDPGFIGNLVLNMTTTDSGLSGAGGELTAMDELTIVVEEDTGNLLTIAQTEWLQNNSNDILYQDDGSQLFPTNTTGNETLIAAYDAGTEVILQSTLTSSDTTTLNTSFDDTPNPFI